MHDQLTMNFMTRESKSSIGRVGAINLLYISETEATYFTYSGCRVPICL